MAEFIEIQWTSGSLDEARKVSRLLVEERLVACAQIIPWIESNYLWKGKLEVTQESKIVLKTRAEMYDKVKEVILKNCKYEVPEITWKSIDGINQEYSEWMAETLGVYTGSTSK